MEYQKDTMKTHTTNYTDTFIEIAEDCPTTKGEIPPLSDKSKSIARLQYEILIKNPYKFTSDDILFQVYVERNDLTENELETARQEFFSKGQPCFRSSPLTKRYGWGIHNDSHGKIAMFGVDTETYDKFVKEKVLTTVKAMRSKRG